MRPALLVRIVPAAVAMLFTTLVAAEPTTHPTPKVERARERQLLLKQRERIRRATVVLPAKACTGFLAQDQTRVMTAAHCIPENATKLVVIASDGVRRLGTLEELDDSADLALLKVDSPIPVEPLALSTELPTPGERVVFLGRTDRKPKLQLAKVERLGRCPSLPDVPNAIFTTVNARPGDSGAPILDVDERVVGIVHGGARCHIAAPVADFAQNLASAEQAAIANDTPTTPSTPDVPEAQTPPSFEAQPGEKALKRRQFGPFTIEETADGYRLLWSFQFSFGKAKPHPTP